MELILIGFTAAVIWWSWDRRRHPLKQCQSCRGTGKKMSSWNGSAYGACLRCGGKGEVHR
ncbi:hypothetical protein ACQPYK_08460 [Streptosporangium sp. CA-135522]|uniref:hypothetical protein n=1 Tax=Streptosporangium sp. CA-135522 TaxID=3240072 RepID=UPI003D8D4642